MVRYLALLSLVLPLSLSFGEDQITHEGATYWLYTVDPAKTKVELHLSEAPGKPNKFTELKARLEKSGRKLKFAMNSGIFEGNFMPTGLHIAEGKTITPLNLDTFVKSSPGEFTPNFFLKPNGVFYILPDGSAGVLESTKYQAAGLSPVLASQSGPLLVQNNSIHPVLTKDSTSKRFRNGVGITKEGKVIFACSVSGVGLGESNLYNFAELFRSKLGCPNALYFDGDISYSYIEGKTPEIRDTNWFAGILAVTGPAAE